MRKPVVGKNRRSILTGICRLMSVSVFFVVFISSVFPDSRKRIKQIKNNITRAGIWLREAKEKKLEVDVQAAEKYLLEAKTQLQKAVESTDKKLTQEEGELKKAAEYSEKAIFATLESRSKEVRAVWLHPQYFKNKREDIVLAVKKLHQAHFNLILPLVFYHGKTIYPSKVAESYGLVPQDEQFKGMDALRLLVEEGRKHHMQIHPWFCVFYLGGDQDRGPVLSKFPQWAAVDKDGKPVCVNGECHGDPAVDELQEYLLKIMIEVVKNYDVDGIHLDYIRYPAQFPVSSSFSEGARKKFKAEYDVDPASLDASDNELSEKWKTWREKQVTRFVERVHKEVKAVKPHVKLSAAVFPPDYASMVLQDWEEWVDRGMLDFLAPMIYSAGWQDYQRTVQNIKQKASNKTMLYPGIGVYLQQSSLDLMKQVKIVQNSSLPGMAFFAYTHLSDEMLSLLREYPFKNEAVMPSLH